MHIEQSRSLRRNVALTKVIFLREFRTMYRRTTLGPVWAILAPCFYLCVFILFRLLFGLGNPEGYPIVPFLFSGLSVWLFFATSLQAVFPSITSNVNVLKKIPVPPLVFVVAATGTPLFTFVVYSFLLEVILVFYGYYPSIHHIMIPIIVIIVLLFSVGVGLIVASVALYRQDIVQLLPSIIQLGMFVTPIFFSPSIIPEKVQWIITINPVAHCVQMLRGAVFEATWPGLEQLSITLCATLAVWLIGFPMFKRTTRYLADVF